MDTRNRFISIGEAARLLDCSTDSVRRYDGGGVVKLMRIAGQRVLTQQDVDTIRRYRDRLSAKRKPTTPD